MTLPEQQPLHWCPPPAGQHCGLLLSRIVVTNMVTGEAASFFCSEWIRSNDPYDFELDAEAEGAQVRGRRWIA